MWKLQAEQQAVLQAQLQAGLSSDKIPSGFVRREGDWYWNEKLQVFWNATNKKKYIFDSMTQKRVEIYEGQTLEINVSAGSVCHERAAEVRHVCVRDLARAAQALRMSIEHLDRPCSMYALYDGHRGSPGGNVCAEFCARHLHGKLLPKLAAFRGYWEDERLRLAIRESFEELDANFAEKHPGVTDGCSAAIALVIGRRLVVASV